MNFTKVKSVSVVGLGKLGLPLALVFASKGYRVFGYDSNINIVNKLQSGISTIDEPFVQGLIIKNKPKIDFSNSPKNAVLKNDFTYIVVPTPSNKDGSFSTFYIEQVLKKLLPYLKGKKQKHTFVITSTISPGTMEKIIKPLINKITKKKIGLEIGLCYSPELIALGSVIKNLSSPDFLFIGESDENTGKMVERIRKSISLNSPKSFRTNWINAELIKLALNSYITTKIDFANMIARISERIAGADSDVVLKVIGQDSRIGTKYLKGGLGYGGPCFPRDNLSLYSTIKKLGLDINLPVMVDEFNNNQVDFLYEIVKKNYIKGQTIGILGLSYKAETDIVEKSQGILLAKKFVEYNIPVVVFDPKGQTNAKKELNHALFTKTKEECIKKSNQIVIATPWNQFKKINWNKYKGKILVDCWRLIDPSKFRHKNNRLIQLGKYIPT